MPNKSSPHGGFIEAGLVVSSDTLRTVDLLESLASEYERVLPFNSSNLVFEANEIREAMLAEPEHPGHASTGDDIVADLFDALDTVAGREGLVFGALEGDGACFGYWSTED